MTELVHKTEAELENSIYLLLKEGKLHEAAAACDALNRDFPNYASGWYASSTVALRAKQPGIALQSVDVALRLSPGKPEWILRKLVCLGAIGDTESALEAAEDLKDVRFDNAHQASNCGLMLNRLGLHELAEHHFRHALELEPDNPSGHYNLATALRYLGRYDEARAALNRSIELRPGDFEAYLLRSGLTTQTKANNNIDDLVGTLDDLPDDDRGRVPLCYALAKEFEDLEQYDRSFDYLQQGAALQRAAISYELDKDILSMRAIREHYTKEVFESPEQGFVNAEPIFVVGMPRSGTMLVSRILNAHSVVRGTAELPVLTAQIIQRCQEISPGVPDALADLVPVSLQMNFAALGEDYVTNARPVADPQAHFIDRLPLNFLYVGLIHLALPKAKIIWLHRDAMDNCYAMYKTLFEGVYPFSFDLNEIAQYYAAYSELMNHWQEVLPDVMHAVRYEDLVNDPRPVIESMLDYCHLSFDEACLKYQQGTGMGASPQAAEARQAMHEQSIGRWRCYKSQLQSVYDVLQKAGLYEG